MAAIDAVIEELDNEAQTTRRVLERIPTEKLAWRPHEKSKSLGELAWHVATLPPRVAAMAQEDEADVTRFKTAPMPATGPEIVQAFERNIAEAKEKLSRLDEAALLRKFVMRRGETKLFSRSKFEFLRTVMLNHTYHHRGQLSVYLRLLGIPVPPIFGPTADEGM